MRANFKKMSRTEWEGDNSTENIIAGCLQRIANSLEGINNSLNTLPAKSIAHQKETAKNRRLSKQVKELKQALKDLA